MCVLEIGHEGAHCFEDMKAEVLITKLPRFDYATIERAHDVRKLGVCKCGGILSKDMAVDLDGEWFHGRCFVAEFGIKSLLALPRSKQDRLTLGDIGVEPMQRLIAKRSRSCLTFD